MSDKRLEALLGSLCPELLAKGHQEAIPCPSSDTLRAFLEGALPAEQRSQLGHHLIVCEDCAATVLAWERVKADDEKAIKGLSAERGKPRHHARFRRFAFPAALTAAAAVVLFLLLPWLMPNPQGDQAFHAQLLNAAGTVRTQGFTPDDALSLSVVLPESAFVYVIIIDNNPFPGDAAKTVHAEFLFPPADADAPAADENAPATAKDVPAAAEEKPLKGMVILPGGDAAWQLKGAAPGTYFVLVGKKDAALTGDEKAALQKALAGMAGPLAEAAIRNTAKPSFQDALVLSFTIQD